MSAETPGPGWVMNFRQGWPSSCLCASEPLSARTPSHWLSRRASKKSSLVLDSQCRKGQGHQHGTRGMAGQTGCKVPG